MQSGLNKIVNNYQVNKDYIQLKNGINELIKEGKKNELNQRQTKKKITNTIKENALLEIIYNESTKKYSIKPPPKKEAKIKEVKIPLIATPNP